MKAPEADGKLRFAPKMPGQGLASPCGVWGRAPLSSIGFDNNGFISSLGRLRMKTPFLFGRPQCIQRPTMGLVENGSELPARSGT